MATAEVHFILRVHSGGADATPTFKDGDPAKTDGHMLMKITEPAIQKAPFDEVLSAEVPLEGDGFPTVENLLKAAKDHMFKRMPAMYVLDESSTLPNYKTGPADYWDPETMTWKKYPTGARYSAGFRVEEIIPEVSETDSTPVKVDLKIGTATLTMDLLIVVQGVLPSTSTP